MQNHRHDVLRSASKSIWRERFTRGFEFYCPMCTTPRRIGMSPKPGQPLHFAQVGITAILITMIGAHFYPWVGWRGLVIFLPLWIGFETIYRARVRAKVTCNKCGFDPLLYLADVEKARAAIQTHWRKRFEEKGIPFPESGARNDAPQLRTTAASDLKSPIDSEEYTESEA
jgi:predicted RNA-binding Zn-ribbon protein involved in translation (DUF1610 family)